jgi:excisionase family DNA binding protein
VSTPLPQDLQNNTSNHNGFIDEKLLRELIPVSRRTLWNWRKRGELPFVQVGRRVLFHYPSVERALLNRQRGNKI